MNHSLTRRHFLQDCSTGLGAMWLAAQGHTWGATLDRAGRGPLTPVAPHHHPKAKRVIFLHMAGAPSHLELFDYKPELAKHDGQDCPESFLKGKRFAFIQGVPKLLGSQFPFERHGQSGAWVSNRLPHFSQLVDEVCFLKGMHTEQFNHAPAQLAMHTGYSTLGYPSMGAWVTYGLGSESENLPGFIVLLSGGKTPDAGKSGWGAGFLPSVYQGVQCRSKGDPVLYLADPAGISRDLRRDSLDALTMLNQKAYEDFGDPETLTRMAQYETAFRMQVSAAAAFDLSQEPETVKSAYGVQPGAESFANNCLMARRLAERGVRFIQLFHWGWDSHGAAESESLNSGFVRQCRDVDRPMSALLMDLKQRGLLDDTLVVWSGEFGRTPMSENRAGMPPKFPGRDHNPGGFTLWMAGGGVRPGVSFGGTDDLGYEAVEGRTSVHDLQATILHLLGFDHKRLTYPYQGLDQRLTNITKPSRVIREVLA
ncbi:MAG TPA: DUF1501 domain-containing protein [Verrucomicrobiota bacterium]|nr:DUF1501 domain-containing protein [Verrucomicrobiota bacterium]